MAAQAIMTGMGDVVMAGGVEMMSAVPMSGFHTRLHPDMAEQNIGMGFTAERVAARWKITREMQDQYLARQPAEGGGGVVEECVRRSDRSGDSAEGALEGREENR